LDERPGAAIAHAELPRRAPKRTAAFDSLQQRDLAGADRAGGTDIQAESHGDHRERSTRPLRDAPRIASTDCTSQLKPGTLRFFRRRRNICERSLSTRRAMRPESRPVRYASVKL